MHRPAGLLRTGKDVMKHKTPAAKHAAGVLNCRGCTCVACRACLFHPTALSPSFAGEMGTLSATDLRSVSGATNSLKDPFLREPLNKSSAAGERIFFARSSASKAGNTSSIPLLSMLRPVRKSFAPSSCRFNQRFLRNTHISSGFPARTALKPPARSPQQRRWPATVR